MNSKTLTRNLALVFFLVNIIAIGAAAFNGYQLGNLAFRFGERQAITYFSSNQLGATSLLAWIIYLLRKKLIAKDRADNRIVLFWAICALGFFFLMLDESFEIHEGMDNSVFRLFGHKENPRLDGVTTGLYGVAAAAVCYYFRTEVLRYRSALVFFILGGVFLAATSGLDIGKEGPVHIVFEEATKLLGVTSFLVAHFAAFFGTLEDIQKTSATHNLTART
jgi:hypothetical protein